MTNPKAKRGKLDPPLSAPERAAVRRFLEHHAVTARNGLDRAKECYAIEPTSGHLKSIIYYEHAGQWNRFLLDKAG